MPTKKTVEQKRRTWKSAEDNYLESLHKKGLRVSAIRVAINKRFGGRRKDSGIEGRLDALGLRSRTNGVQPAQTRKSRLHRQVVLDLGNEGRITILLEGKLSQNNGVRQKANALVAEAAGAAKYLRV